MRVHGRLLAQPPSGDGHDVIGILLTALYTTCTCMCVCVCAGACRKFSITCNSISFNRVRMALRWPCVCALRVCFDKYWRPKSASAHDGTFESNPIERIERPTATRCFGTVSLKRQLCSLISAPQQRRQGRQNESYYNIRPKLLAHTHTHERARSHTRTPACVSALAPIEISAPC